MGESIVSFPRFDFWNNEKLEDTPATFTTSAIQGGKKGTKLDQKLHLEV